MAKHSRNPEKNRRALAVSLAVTALLLAAGMTYGDGMDPGRIVQKILWPLARLMAMIAVGVLAAQVLENAGWTRWMAMAAGPLFRFGRMGDRCSAAFTMAFVSGAAANAMLFDYFKEGLISRRQLFLTNFANQLPAFFLHLPTTFFVVIAMTKWAGGLYFLLTFIAAVGRTALVLVIGHFFPGPEAGKDTANGSPEPAPASRKKTDTHMKAVARRFQTRVMGIAVYVMPIYVAVQLLTDWGAFDWVRRWLAMDVVSDVVPVEAASVVVLSFVAEFTSAFAAAGAMMDAGVITVKQTVMALLMGNVLAFPIRSIRHQLPRYMGIFSPKLGAELLVTGQIFRVVSIVLVGWGYHLLA